MREKLALIQQAFRTNPRAADLVKAELLKDGGKPLFDVEHMRARATAHIGEINAFMQQMRVLCVITNKDSERMWSDYAENHKGIVLRIEPNVAKDSNFQRFQPVIYRDKRPPLYDDTIEFIVGGLFGDLQARIRTIIEKIIYAKALKLQHECEYRLAIPIGQDEEPYDTLSYHPEDEIVAKARKINQNIAIFQAKRDAKSAIAFERILRNLHGLPGPVGRFAGDTVTGLRDAAGARVRMSIRIPPQGA
jgi:hypothetical protein